LGYYYERIINCVVPVGERLCR